MLYVCLVVLLHLAANHLDLDNVPLLQASSQALASGNAQVFRNSLCFCCKKPYVMCIWVGPLTPPDALQAFAFASAVASAAGGTAPFTSALAQASAQVQHWCRCGCIPTATSMMRLSADMHRQMLNAFLLE